MRTVVRFFTFVAAVAIGAGVGHLVVSDWVMPQTPQSAALELGSEAVGVSHIDNRAQVARKVVPTALPQQRRWIAEAKVGPYRQQAVRVEGVNDDGSPRVVRIGMGEARRGFAAAVQNSARRGAKAPVDERWARLKDHSSGGGGGT